MMGEATDNFAVSSYRLLLPFKLRDPGVHLRLAEERADESGHVRWDVLKLSFDPGVGPTPGDVYYLLVNKETHLIDTLEIVATGKTDDQRFGLALDGWQTVGGLKVATVLRTLGYGDVKAPLVQPTLPAGWKDVPPLSVKVPSSGQYLFFLDLAVRPEPDDYLYVPAVTDHAM